MRAKPEFTKYVREEEAERICDYISLMQSNAILEIGGGAGYQAAHMESKGFDITSIDVETSNHKGKRLFQLRTR